MAHFLKERHHEFDKYFEDAPTDVEQRDRVADDLSLWHLAGTIIDGAWKDEDVIKEENVQWIFDKLGQHFHLVLCSRESHAL